MARTVPETAYLTGQVDKIVEVHKRLSLRSDSLLSLEAACVEELGVPAHKIESLMRLSRAADAGDPKALELMIQVNDGEMTLSAATAEYRHHKESLNASKHIDPAKQDRALAGFLRKAVELIDAADAFTAIHPDTPNLRQHTQDLVPVVMALTRLERKLRKVG